MDAAGLKAQEISRFSSCNQEYSLVMTEDGYLVVSLTDAAGVFILFEFSRSSPLTLEILDIGREGEDLGWLELDGMFWGYHICGRRYGLGMAEEARVVQETAVALIRERTPWVEA